MPDRNVKTIQDLIYYQYAKVVARSAFVIVDGKKAKKEHYGFIKKTFEELKSGIKSWSDITREDWQLVEAEKVCIYCGSENNLNKEHIIPKSLNINSRCATCEKIQGIHNQIWSCKNCNSQKGTMGLYKFYKAKHPDDKKFYDIIPSLAEKKYLKTIYDCHICANTLESGDVNGDGELTVIDIDSIIK